MVLKAIKDAKEWQNAQKLEPVPKVPCTRGKLVGSSSSPLNINPGPICFVDAAWNPSSGTCGIGGVFKNISPQLPDISASHHFVSSALMAEAIALRSTVMCAASSNLRSLTVLSDSQVLISMLKTKTSKPALFGILFDIYHFGSVLDSISFMFVPCLKNLEADSVAKLALAMDDSLSPGGK